MLKLSALFSEHAVLQSGISIPVWGWTEPKTLVECSLAGERGKVMAQPDGKFLLRLKALPYGGPHELRVRNISSGEEAVVGDIMIGEVWLASGQSNMEWTMASCNDNDAILNSDLPRVRMITVPKMARVGGMSDFEGEWRLASPQVTGEFSAVGFHFARKLNAELGITVGVINSSWGGTCAETWNSRESLMANPGMVPVVQSYESRLYHDDIWKNAGECDVSDPEALLRGYLESLTIGDLGNRGLERGWAAADFDDSAWRTMGLPRSWKVAGENYSGVLWFRKTVEIPESLAREEWRLDIGAVDKQDISYVNGVEVGATGQGLETAHWNKLREYRIPAGTIKAGRNVIAVRAYSFIYDGGMIGPADCMRIFPVGQPEKAIPLAGEWRFDTEVNLGITSPPPNDVIIGPGAPNSPYMLFDNMIKPLLPYGIRGAIWYQGESNANRWQHYRGLMESLIRDWRRAWGQGDFPFYQVQLANYMAPQAYQQDSTWAHIREAQLKSAELGGGAAVIIDSGEAEDIHPKDKKTVGERLAALALHRTYQRHGTVPCGPVYSHMAIEGAAIRLYFKHCEGGLQGTNGFFMADSSGFFSRAEAVIEGDTVLVSSPNISIPQMVRYAWADNPEGADLRNGAGFPASPFRTDCE